MLKQSATAVTQAFRSSDCAGSSVGRLVAPVRDASAASASGRRERGQAQATMSCAMMPLSWKNRLQAERLLYLPAFQTYLRQLESDHMPSRTRRSASSIER